MKKDSSKNSLAVYEGSGNIFEDLNVPNAEEHELKAQLAIKINSAIESLQCSQAQIAQTLGIKQPHVSQIANYKLQGFSVERLMHFLVRLGRSLVIQVSAEVVEKPAVRVVTQVSTLSYPAYNPRTDVESLRATWTRLQGGVVLKPLSICPLEESDFGTTFAPKVERVMASFEEPRRTRLQ